MTDKLKRVRHPMSKERVRVQLDTGTETKVRQSFKEEADIDNILKKYANTGLLPAMRDEPIFADVSEVEDYKTALDKVRNMGNLMQKLPKEARELLEADPAKFQALMTEDVTREKLEEYQIIPKKEDPPVVEDPPVEPAEPA